MEIGRCFGVPDNEMTAAQRHSFLDACHRPTIGCNAGWGLIMPYLIYGVDYGPGIEADNSATVSDCDYSLPVFGI